MKKYLSSGMLLAFAMLIAAGMTVLLTPSRDQETNPVDLEAMIPKQFGQWTQDTTVLPLIVSPDAQAILDKIYSATLSRTYVNANGERIMLSLAYGADQSRALQVHKPEVCYTMQGFQIGMMAKQLIGTATAEIPVMRLMAAKGPRQEPITYWIRVGDDVVRGWYEQNLAKVRYGLSGRVPDGMLVRVSNLSVRAGESYELHQQFISDLLASVKPEYRAVLIGNLPAHRAAS